VAGQNDPDNALNLDACRAKADGRFCLLWPDKNSSTPAERRFLCVLRVFWAGFREMHVPSYLTVKHPGCKSSERDLSQGRDSMRGVLSGGRRADDLMDVMVHGFSC
jgi:hypothetical protein